MPKKDTYHDAFVAALRKDGWTVTHDPYFVRVDGLGMYIDVAAERVKNDGVDTIAAEVKNFISLSDMNEFQKAIGQYEVYKSVLNRKDHQRELFLAVPTHFYFEIKTIQLYNDVLNDLRIKVVVFEVEDQNIIKWIS